MRHAAVLTAYRDHFGIVLDEVPHALACPQEPLPDRGPAVIPAGPPDLHFIGVDDGTRTHDPQDHNLVL